MKSTAANFDEYLNGLPTERRETISAVRKVILANQLKATHLALSTSTGEGLRNARSQTWTPTNAFQLRKCTRFPTAR
jgi:hypothetical protein